MKTTMISSVVCLCVDEKELPIFRKIAILAKLGPAVDVQN